MNFTRGYSDVTTNTSASEVVVVLSTTEPLNFERQDFFDSGVKSVWLTTDSGKKSLHFSFDGAVIEPSVVRGDTSVQITFTLPINPVQQSQQPVVSTGTYVRMIIGLFLIFVLILGMYLVVKYLLRGGVRTDIPGVGRMLGSVDVGIKRSLIFYELGDVIYILGATDGGINVVDKIADPASVTLIKTGFTRRKDFASYLNFFSKSGEIKDDIKNSRDLLEDKLSSLRKK
ncbi:hypothetical protein AGMMS49941_09970 [Deferribacterales bacterium]|nr:hypothetical protein AGMMS49941_09970 [Deferribacterales bacterium]